ncbi:MAG: CCA tRNA nucleotidyltransferase [Elusimicrobia bacterium]|nr:CCA tRNA nucleotidyltransferase [Elusimicrobiota bacterium]
MDIYKIDVYIELARKIEKETGCDIYIVGGYVRDKILGFKSIDLDFVASPNGLEVAEIFYKKLGGKLTVYKKFLTASLKLKNGFVIDIATARQEEYPEPASMPVVYPAKIEDDLKRRDFTINAIATPVTNYKLQITNYIDPCGGLEDIKNRQIRVLHKDSFTDDPTRILRAIRYACRFDFKIEKNTHNWMASAVKKDLLSLVSPPRIRDEFIKTLEEKKAKKILKEFEKQKVLKYIDKNLKISAISSKSEPMEIRLKKLLEPLKNKQKTSFLKKLQLPSKYS